MGCLFPYRHSGISHEELVTLVKNRKSFHITMSDFKLFKQCQYYIYYHAVAYKKKPAGVAMYNFSPDGRLRLH